MSLRDEFGLDYSTIYKVWAGYGMARAQGHTPVEAVRAVKIAYPEEQTDYFIALALELITGKMIEGAI